MSDDHRLPPFRHRSRPAARASGTGDEKKTEARRPDPQAMTATESIAPLSEGGEAASRQPESHEELTHHGERTMTELEAITRQYQRIIDELADEYRNVFGEVRADRAAVRGDVVALTGRVAGLEISVNAIRDDLRTMQQRQDRWLARRCRLPG
jgi:hypothetical protein